MKKDIFFLIFMAITSLALGQNTSSNSDKPQAEYSQLTKKADSLFTRRQFREAALTYSKAFNTYGGSGTTQDIYLRAAQSWAEVYDIAGKTDSSFRYLNGCINIARGSVSRTSQNASIIRDPFFHFFQTDSRWEPMTKMIKYYEIEAIADSFYNIKEYKKAAFAYSDAFKILGWRSVKSAKDWAAISWAQAGYPDSAFYYLMRMPSRDFRPNWIITDTILLPLHNDPRWEPLITSIKYLNIEWNADSLYNIKEYKKAAFTYSDAFKIVGWKSIFPARLWAAHAWTQAGNNDSAFFNLNKFLLGCQDNNYDCTSILKDTLLKPLHNDPRWNTLFNILNPEMIEVTGGTFTMGDNNLGLEPHSVTLRSFKISKTEITVSQWIIFCKSLGKDFYTRGHDPEWGWYDNDPIVDITWDDAVAYCKWLSHIDTPNIYRLPTEADYEYAARGGINSHGYTYSGGNNLDSVAWYGNNSFIKVIVPYDGPTYPNYQVPQQYKNIQAPHPVGEKKPNELGLYDMSGNVSEWCLDFYDPGYYGISPLVNPKGPETGGFMGHVIRGGSFRDYDQFGVANRSYSQQIYRDDIGFRVVCVR